MSELITKTIAGVKPVSADLMKSVSERWDDLIKPPGSLGMLEVLTTRLIGAIGHIPMKPLRKMIVVMCADHGVVEAGVTPNGQEVTAMMTALIGANQSVVGRMAHNAGADQITINIGVKVPVYAPGVINRVIRQGTRNFAVEPAMTRDEAERAIEIGIKTAADLVKQGYEMLATGEMGIGNTTASSAIMAAMLNLRASETTGAGAGVTPERLALKVSVIDQALKLHRPDPSDPIDVLAKVGGLEIAGLVGVILGGAAAGVPVVIDGFISSAAAIIATRLCPAAIEYVMASHVSEERAAARLLGELGLTAPIKAGMRLGEGTGAAAVMPLIEMALAVFRETPTLSGTGVGEFVGVGDERSN